MGREELLRSGYLVAVPDRLARNLRLCSVAFEQSFFEQHVANQEGWLQECGVMWDVLWELQHAMRTAHDFFDELYITVPERTRGGQSYRSIRARAIFGSYKGFRPCITISDNYL